MTKTFWMTALVSLAAFMIVQTHATALEITRDGAAAAIMEMLFQSYGRVIQLFPTIPDRWHDAYFADLRAEGAFVVTAKLEAGKVVFAEIISEAGLPCRLQNPFGAEAEVKSYINSDSSQEYY